MSQNDLFLTKKQLFKFVKYFTPMNKVEMKSPKEIAVIEMTQMSKFEIK